MKQALFRSEQASQSGPVVDVAVPLPIFKTFSYLLPDQPDLDCQPGVRVVVPFRNRHLIGLVVRRHPRPDELRLKPLEQVLDRKPLLTPALIQLGEWLSAYYFAPPGEAFRVMLPPKLLAKKASPDQDPRAYWPARRQLAVVGLKADRGSATPAQAEQLAALAALQLPLPASRAVRRLSCSYQSLRAMERKGLLELAEIEVDRSPWLEPAATEVIPHQLSSDQSSILEAILARLDQGFGSLLLHGVTGSGKTEVYLNAIGTVLERGKSALVLVPEIGLTPQVSRQFRGWFGDEVAILHSALSEGERFDQWRRIRAGKARVAIGTRSAVFAPLVDLGLVIVDEEHDHSYKQEEIPRYHGRDVALKRAQIERALVVLGSATPQLETYYRASTREGSALAVLRSRVQERPLPTVHIVDMRVEFQRRGKEAVLSELLAESIEDRLAQKEQILILLNRRGWAAAALCRSCGYLETCVNCSVSLTYHQEVERLCCHYCGYARSVPRSCAECGKEYIYFVGLGTEQVQELLQEKFPEAVIGRLDRDTVSRKGSYQKILGAFARRKTDVLVGTQMISKGHDFPGVTLVGVLGADQGLRLADFRAAERTFQLLTQVAGRSGRGEKMGEVIIQTYFPNHYSLKYACDQDYDRFYRKEIDFRKKFRYPPFVALVNIVISGNTEESTRSLAERCSEILLEQRGVHSSTQRMRVLGPASAVLERIKRDYRFQILIKTTNRGEMHFVLKETLEQLGQNGTDLKRISIDVDPVNLM